MKIGTFVRLLVVVTVGFSSLSAQVTFEQARTQLRARYDKKLPDGTVKVSKQVRRWEWFWEPRQLADGTLPPSSMYFNAANNLQSRPKSEQVQARPTWKELGPVAPDLPNESSVWNGIGRVNAFDISHQNLNLMWLGSAQGGVWKTTNAGGNWVNVPVPGYPVFGVSDVAIAPTDDKVIYVATGDAEGSIPSELGSFPNFTYGVVKTTDGGATWASAGLQMQPVQNQIISRLWVDPRDANVVLAATYSGIMKTTNGGTSWRLVSAPSTFKDLIGNPQTYDVLYATTFTYNTGGASIYRSTNAGESWELTLTVNEANRIRLSVTKAAPGVLGAVASDASTQGLFAIYKSTDYGESFIKMVPPQNLLGWSSSGNDWQYGGQGFYDLAMEISPTNPNAWFVGGVNMWRSTNAGQSWVLSAHWTGSGAPWVHADCHFMKYSYSQGRLYAATDGGIARSTDNGVSWRDISNGLAIQQYYGIATTDLNASLTMAGAQDNGTALSKNGTNFYHVLDGDGMACDFDKLNTQLCYASQPYGSIHRSTNQGDTWRMISTPGQRGEGGAAWVAPIAADPKTGNTVYIGYAQVYKSTNSGTSWTRISQISATEYLKVISVAPTNSNYIYIGYSTSLYYTTNGGASWTKQAGVGEYIQDIEVDPTDPKKIYVSFGGFTESAKVFEITNGVVKNITGVGIPNVPCNSVLFQKGPLNRIYIGTDVGVLFKDEGSSSWEPYGEGMPAAVVTDMELLPTSSKLRISTHGRGVWEITAQQCLAAMPNVAVSGPTTFCSGDSLVLVAASGYKTYQWSNGTRSDRLVLKNAVETGIYTVSVEDDNGCRNTSTPINVVILRSPIKPNISLKSPDTLRSSAIGGITQFQWYWNSEMIPGATQREHVAQKTGSYTVIVKNADACPATSDPYNVTVVGVEDENGSLKDADVWCWPNPTTGRVDIHLPNATQRTVEIVNVIGEVMLAESIVDGVEQTAVHMDAFASGMYVVRVRSGNALWSSVVVKR